MNAIEIQFTERPGHSTNTTIPLWDQGGWDYLPIPPSLLELTKLTY